MRRLGGWSEPAAAADVWEASAPSTWVRHPRPRRLPGQGAPTLPAPGSLLSAFALSPVPFPVSSLVALGHSLSPVGPSVLTPRAPPAQPGVGAAGWCASVGGVWPAGGSYPPGALGGVSFGDVVQPEHSVGALGISGSFHGGESPGKGTPAAAGATSPAQDILQPVFQLSSVMASEAEQCVARSNREMY